MLDVLPHSPQEVEDIIDYVCSVGIHQTIHYTWRPQLRDPGDDMVLELALAAGCSHIVTHNVRDFARAAWTDIRVLTPREFLHLLEKPS